VQSNDVDPACIISPTATADVAVAVGVINQLSDFQLQCPFAIRGGGHTPWAGASTIANGIVIDLSAINQITVSNDQTVTSVGPGARWIDAYLKLDALNLAISGGRVASVGVAGLTTGGMHFTLQWY
jgi:FAD/FMN-containing dehydrogenase